MKLQLKAWSHPICSWVDLQLSLAAVACFAFFAHNLGSHFFTLFTLPASCWCHSSFSCFCCSYFFLSSFLGRAFLTLLLLWSSQLSFLGSGTPSSAELLKTAKASQYHYHSSQAYLCPPHLYEASGAGDTVTVLLCVTLCYSQHFCLRVPQNLKDSLLNP